ncbi:ABC transporter permease [Psychrobacillus lasiicapitis]|uniref:ABC transporter permease n=1 Tax=Psychrobacillus lasiicapitis TaxID=1636719 RepID=A0A544T5E0_9BACI|nr:ABC transporter permease [Psychrobacillus lasiicapitis]
MVLYVHFVWMVCYLYIAIHCFISKKRGDIVKGIWLARLQNLKRKPLVLISMTVMTIIFAYILSGGVGSSITLLVATDDTDMSNKVLERLQHEDDYSITVLSEAELQEVMKEKRDKIGLQLQEKTYSVLVDIESDVVRMLSLEVVTIYNELAFQEQIITNAGESKWEEVEESMAEEPSFLLKKSSMDESQVFRYDGALQSLFGFMLYFVFYTISINVQFILEDKRTGIWNRLKLASISRFQLYFGHLSFSYLIGLIQMLLVIFLFRFIIGTNMYGGFWKVVVISSVYVLLVMAFSLFIISLVKTVSQSSVIISLLAVAFAMIGGAYWPLEIVQSEGLLALKWISPIYYGMEALKRVTIYGETLGGVFSYICMMILLAILLIVIGITLLEKRTERYHSSE